MMFVGSTIWLNRWAMTKSNRSSFVVASQYERTSKWGWVVAHGRKVRHRCINSRTSRISAALPLPVARQTHRSDSVYLALLTSATNIPSSVTPNDLQYVVYTLESVIGGLNTLMSWKRSKAASRLQVRILHSLWRFANVRTCLLSALSLVARQSSFL